MRTKKKIKIIGILTSTILLGSIFTYSYFLSPANNQKKSSANLTTGTMSLIFSDGNETIKGQILPGETLTKKFII